MPKKTGTLLQIVELGEYGVGSLRGTIGGENRAVKQTEGLRNRTRTEADRQITSVPWSSKRKPTKSKEDHFSNRSTRPSKPGCRHPKQRKVTQEALNLGAESGDGPP